MLWTTHLFTTKPATVRDGLQLDAVTDAGMNLRSPRRPLAAIEGRVQATGFHDATAEVAEFWRVLAESMTRCLPADPPWTRVFVDIRPDSGTVAASLRDAKDERRAIPIVVNCVLRFVQHISLSIPDPDEDEEAFDAGMAALRQETRDALIAGAAEPTARSALDRLCAEHVLTIDLTWAPKQPSVRIAGA